MLYFLALLRLLFIYYYCREENESEREGKAFNMNTPLSHTTAEKEKTRECVVVIPPFSGVKPLLHTLIFPSSHPPKGITD